MMERNQLPDITVGIQGSNGSYSEMAAYLYFQKGNGKYFKVNPVIVNFDHSEQVFDALEKKVIDFAFLPIENSIIGNINLNMDLLNHYNFFAFGEQYLKIEHCLLATPDTQLKDIKKIFSHPAALEQCRDYIIAHHFESIPAFDTAGAAKIVLKNEGIIASEAASVLYGLKILDKNIQKVKNNFTRFLIIRNNDSENAGLSLPQTEGEEKTSLSFTTDHKPGSLLLCLEIFARHNLNLSKIESRPLPDNPFMYTFFVDLDSHMDESRMKDCLADLKNETLTIKILGSYPRGSY